MTISIRRLAVWWLPVLLWAGLIFILSSIPNLGTGLGIWDTILRKIAHLAEYGALAGLLWRAFTRDTALPGRVVPWLTLALVAAYAISDEIHQSYVPTRHGSPVDVAIDVVGGGLMLYALALVARRREKRARAGTDRG